MAIFKRLVKTYPIKDQIVKIEPLEWLTKSQEEAPLENGTKKFDEIEELQNQILEKDLFGKFSLKKVHGLLLLL